MERGKPPALTHAATRALSLAVLTVSMSAHSTTTSNDATNLKKLSLEDLLNVEVTSVSRRPEKLTQAASAVQVITDEEVIRAGATSLPEALRLAPNLQVAHVNSSQWAISSRGFDNVLANKLLVMIDGRTVYTPLYAGVFWDVQHTLLEDLDRIEVISGPGGTLWGANAVNGVINIMTKSADKTQGLFLSGGMGDELRNFGEVRYGGQIGDELHYRIYGIADDRDDTKLKSGADANDPWHSKQAGFRLDWDRAGNAMTLQSDWYNANPNPDGTVPTPVGGGNVLGRWKHSFSERTDFQLQIYYDRTQRSFGNGLAVNLDTYDLDWQHRLQLGDHQEIVWGLGGRLMDDSITNLPLFAFLPAHRTLHLYSAFLQDEVRIFDDRLRLTVGAKVEHNDYTGTEVQPNGRLAWEVTEQQTAWAAVSRAVRTPSRIDRDFYLFATPTLPVIAGDGFESETVRAYELGWRAEPSPRFNLSLAAFYNEYDDLRSAEPGPPPFNLPITFQNGVEGQSYGAELAATYGVTSFWKLRGGYTFFRKHLVVKPQSRDLNHATSESDDPQNQLLVQSMLTLPYRLQLDCVVRYVDSLPNPRVPSYLGLDVRFAWAAPNNLEVAIVGQNLLDDHHAEFVPASPSPRDIERGVYGKISWRY